MKGDWHPSSRVHSLQISLSYDGNGDLHVGHTYAVVLPSGARQVVGLDVPLAALPSRGGVRGLQKAVLDFTLTHEGLTELHAPEPRWTPDEAGANEG